MASKSYFFCFGVEIRFGSLIAVFRCFSPHLCVGFLFLILYPGSARLLPASSSRPASRRHLFTHIFVTHHLCQPTLSTIFHTSFTHHLSHTIFHTPSLTHHLSHTSLSTTIFHTPSFTHHLLHTPSFTHHLCQPPSFTHHLLHTIFRFPPGVALGGILVTYTFVLRGRRGTYGVGLALVARLGRFWSPVAPRHFAWQAWHLVTSTFVSRGRRGTWSHPPSFCVAGVALMALGWLWWRAWAGFGRR